MTTPYKTVKVNECRRCPFLDFVPPGGVWVASWHCKHPSSFGGARVADYGDGRPPWCPLVNGGTLVELAKSPIRPADF